MEKNALRRGPMWGIKEVRGMGKGERISSTKIFFEAPFKNKVSSSSDS